MDARDFSGGWKGQNSGFCVREEKALTRTARKIFNEPVAFPVSNATPSTAQPPKVRES